MSEAEIEASFRRSEMDNTRAYADLDSLYITHITESTIPTLRGERNLEI